MVDAISSSVCDCVQCGEFGRSVEWVDPPPEKPAAVVDLNFLNEPKSKREERKMERKKGIHKQFLQHVSVSFSSSINQYQKAHHHHD